MIISNYNFIKKHYDSCLNYELKKNGILRNKTNKVNSKHLKDLNEKGYTIIKNLFPNKIIDEIKIDFKKQIQELKNIHLPRDLRSKKKDKNNIVFSKLDEKTFLSGEKKFKNLTDSIKLKDPLINIPKIINLLLNKKIKSITSNYFGCMPYLTFVKLVKTYKNNMKENDTQLFHIDDNSVKLLKCFIYLNDVNSKNDGPTYYIKGSFKNINKYWGKKLRWSEKELLNIYEKKNFIPIYAKKGDVILANTIAFHRGIKPKKKTDTSLLPIMVYIQILLIIINLILLQKFPQNIIKIYQHKIKNFYLC
jgi:hypothetical protein